MKITKKEFDILKTGEDVWRGTTVWLRAGTCGMSISKYPFKNKITFNDFRSKTLKEINEHLTEELDRGFEFNKLNEFGQYHEQFKA